MNRPRASILTLFDPLHAPSTPPRHAYLHDDGSDKENSTPDVSVSVQTCGQTTVFFQRMYSSKDRKMGLPRSPRGLLVDIDEEAGRNESVDDSRSGRDWTPGGKAPLREIKQKKTRASDSAHRSGESGVHVGSNIKSNATGSEHSMVQSSVQYDQNVSAALHTESLDSLTMVINSINRPAVTLTRPPSPPNASLPCADSTSSPALTSSMSQSPTSCLSKLNASGTSLLSPSISLSPSTAFLIPSPTGKLLTRSKLSMVVEECVDEEDEEKAYLADGDGDGRQPINPVAPRNDASDTPPLSVRMSGPMLQQSRFNASFDLLNDDFSFFAKIGEDSDLDSNTSETNNVQSQAEHGRHLATTVSKAMPEHLQDVVKDNPPVTTHAPQPQRVTISGRQEATKRKAPIEMPQPDKEGRPDFTATIYDIARVGDSQVEHSQAPSIQIRPDFKTLVPREIKPLRIQKLKPKAVEQVSSSDNPKSDPESTRVVAIKPSKAQRPPPGMICAIPPAIGRSADSRPSPALNAMDHTSIPPQPRRARQLKGVQPQSSDPTVSEPVAPPKGTMKGTQVAGKGRPGSDRVENCPAQPMSAARQPAIQATTRSNAASSVDTSVGQPTSQSLVRSTLPVPTKKASSSGIPRPASSKPRLPAPGFRLRETRMK